MGIPAPLPASRPLAVLKRLSKSMLAGVYPFPALKGKRLQLGVCGSIAAYKAIELMRMLQKLEVAVSVTVTDAASRFIPPLNFEALGADVVYTRMFGQDEGILYGHLEPGRVANAFMIAPCSADALARVAGGFANEILSAQVLAFDGPLVIAPAMNPRMWHNPATQENVALLRKRGAAFVFPASGTVACGDDGDGKLADLFELCAGAAKALLPQDLQGTEILLTLGPTRESWDGVRIWTNLSTGLMGASITQAAWLRGATVHAVAGPGVPRLPSGVLRYDVNSAAEMYDAAAALWDKARWGIFTAAVADFSPELHTGGKFKKSGSAQGMDVHFTPNRDILATLAAKAGQDQRILAFAAETDRLEEQSREKLARKKAHLLAGNLVGTANSGFASETNRMYVCDHRGREEHWPLASKADVAWRLLDWLLTL